MKELFIFIVFLVMAVIALIFSPIMLLELRGVDDQISRSFCGGKAVETYYRIADEKTGSKEKMFRCTTSAK